MSVLEDVHGTGTIDGVSSWRLLPQQPGQRGEGYGICCHGFSEQWLGLHHQSLARHCLP
jgi:hypothetical protein